VAVCAEQILLFAIPVTGALTVDADFPVAQFVAMALTAEPIGFGEGDLLAGHQAQLVPVVEVVTVQTPTLPLGVLEDDVVVHFDQVAPLWVWLHVCMAVGAGKDPLGKWWWGYREDGPLVSPPLVAFNLFLDNQITMTVKELFDLSCRGQGGTKYKHANGQR